MYDYGAGSITTYVYTFEEQRRPFIFDHNTRNGLFILTLSVGTEERFRDKPGRHLLVEPDTRTGEMRPVIKRGRQSYVWLCREEREKRPRNPKSETLNPKSEIRRLRCIFLIRRAVRS
jgi:hypothetical protein